MDHLVQSVDPFVFRFSLFVLAAGALGTVGGLMLYARTPYARGMQDPIEQPIQFDHRHHVLDDGIRIAPPIERCPDGMPNHLRGWAAGVRGRNAHVEAAATAIPDPTHMTHNTEINDAKNWNLGIWNGLQELPNPLFGARLPQCCEVHRHYHCAPG